MSSLRENRSPASPVIVIGMHRSGTALLTRLLEDLGLFVGARKDSSHEAFLFQKLNRWLMNQSGGAWDHPEPFLDLLEDEHLRTTVESYLTDVLDSPRAASFLGPLRYLRYRSVLELQEPWGWKDPRTTFTLPIWRSLFPDARVVHIRRHGVDVAASLLRRREERLDRRTDVYERIPFLSWFLLPRRFTDTVSCQTLHDGLALWERYLQQAEEHVDTLGDDALTVRYESLLEEPVQVLEDVATFAGLDPHQENVESAADRVDPSRAYAFREDPDRQAFAAEVTDRLAAAGYKGR